jgi:ATP adenylyltransferase
MSSQTDCPFCSFAEIERRMIGRNDYGMVFLTNRPITPGHILVCPVRHIESSDELTSKELGVMHYLLRISKIALRECCGAEGFNVAWNEGEVAGQTVPHLHIHVVPRRAGDTGILGYEPRQFLYRPGPRQESSEDELAGVASLLRPHF